MTTKKLSGASTQHAFFRAMVLMGGSVAASCGGATTDDTAATDTAQPGSGGESGGTAEDSGTGGAVGTGGLATGGTFVTGGTGAIANVNGGTSGDGGANTGTGSNPGTVGTSMPYIDSASFDPSCPPTQWSCSREQLECTYPDGYRLPQGCLCDPGRPRSIDDCTSTETFVCLRGAYTSDGTALSEPTPFECACIPRKSYCRDACDIAWPIAGGGLECVDDPDAGSAVALCSCAFIYLQ
jgi:hypothetical protein